MVDGRTDDADGRRTDAGSMGIPCDPNGSGELIKFTFKGKARQVYEVNCHK